MTIQYIIDRAQQIEIDRRRMVGQTISRSQRIKTAERSTSQPFKFKVTPPGAMRWEDARGVIEVINTQDRVTEYEISLNGSPGMNYITAYQGDLNSGQLSAMTISTSSTATMTLGSLPSIGAAQSTSTVALTAKSIAFVNNITYNKALSTDRSDFIINTTTYDNLADKPLPGDVLSAPTYITSGQTVSSVTRNYITISGVSYTRIVMSAPPNASSPAATTDFSSDIAVTATRTTLVGSTSLVFKRGDLIQPANSRYPYVVTQDVTRGTDTTITVSLHRPIITSEGVNISGQTLKVGNSTTFRVVVIGLPTYTLIPGRRVQYTGDFELIEKVI